MQISADKRLKIYQYLETPFKERGVTKLEFRKSLGVSPERWRLVQAEWQMEQELKPQEPRNKEHDSAKFLREHNLEVDEGMLEACKRGNAAAAKLWKQLTGELVEKSETKVEFTLSADEHFRIREEAQRRISDVCGGTNGDRGMRQELRVLPEKIREDTPSPKGDNSV